MSSTKSNAARTKAAIIPSPLGAYTQQFQRHLERLHYSPASMIDYMRCLGALGNRVKTLHIDVKGLDSETAVGLIAKPDQPARRSKYQCFMVKSFIKFLTGLGVVKPPLEAVSDDTGRAHLKRNYEGHLRHQRGLSNKTIFHNWRVADRFLTFRFGKEIGDLSKITAGDIVTFLQQLTARRPLVREKTLSSHLRNFFRYLFQHGETAANLALGIPSVAQRYGTRLPRHLTAEQVDTLIKAVRSGGGQRNYAMVLLIARLGLRAPEVIAMQIDDIDWRSGEIVVRGKGNRHDRVPLPADVGEAVADYIRLERVTTTRALFVTERAPHHPFKGGQILNSILQDAFTRTGLTPPAPYVGSHVLRHSLATSLLQRGAPLEEISDTLRHRSRATTMIYARLDVDGLRSIAQPWPIAGGAK